MLSTVALTFYTDRRSEAPLLWWLDAAASSLIAGVIAVGWIRGFSEDVSGFARPGQPTRAGTLILVASCTAVDLALCLRLRLAPESSEVLLAVLAVASASAQVCMAGVAATSPDGTPGRLRITVGAALLAVVSFAVAALVSGVAHGDDGDRVLSALAVADVAIVAVLVVAGAVAEFRRR